MENKIIEGTYSYYYESPQEEIELTNSILKDVNLENKEELLKSTEKILELPVDKQMHIIHCVLDTMYKLSDETGKNDNIASFLAQKVFSTYREILGLIVNDDLTSEEKIEKIEFFENELNIKIIDGNE